MYISRVEIDRNNRRKIRDLTHLGAFHSWVEDSFPEEKKTGERSRKLWRVDQLKGKEYLLLVSEKKPDRVCLEKYGVEGSAETKDYDALLDSLEEGMRIQFKVKLNPVMRKSAGTGNSGKIIPLVSDKDQMNFILERSEKNGFELEDFLIIEKGHERLKQKRKRDLYVVKAVYQGELTITNVEQFKKTLTCGIGRKKAYGFGLMTVIL